MFGFAKHSEVDNARQALEKAQTAASAAADAAREALARFEAEPDEQTGLARMVAEQRSANAGKAVADARDKLAALERAEHEQELARLVAVATEFGAEDADHARLAAMAHELETICSAAEARERTNWAAVTEARAYAREHGLPEPEIRQRAGSAMARAQSAVARSLRDAGLRSSRANWLAWNPIH